MALPRDHAIACAARVLNKAGLVAFPTETCYGLAADPFNERALYTLFQVKNRSFKKPVLLLIDDLSLLETLVARIPEIYLPLIERYWPGPLTLIFPARPELSPLLTGGTGTVGVRISPHPLARQLIQAFGRAITATSANLSGLPPACSAAEIRSQFGEKVDFVLDGGISCEQRCSTIVSTVDGKLHLVRAGVIDLEGRYVHDDPARLRE